MRPKIFGKLSKSLHPPSCNYRPVPKDYLELIKHLKEYLLLKIPLIKEHFVLKYPPIKENFLLKNPPLFHHHTHIFKYQLPPPGPIGRSSPSFKYLRVVSIGRIENVEFGTLIIMLIFCFITIKSIRICSDLSNLWTSFVKNCNFLQWISMKRRRRKLSP